MARRRQSAVARKALREGKAPEMVATRLQLKELQSADWQVGGMRLLCDCMRQWVLPAELLGQGRCGNEATNPEKALAITRFEPPHIRDRLPTPSATGDQGRCVKAKAAWDLSTSALMLVVAELWTEICEVRMGELKSGRRLDVAAVLWERLLHKHGLKSVAQRALADFTMSLRAEVSDANECPYRLKLAAQMIGLSPTEGSPWPEAKCLFFFWLLPLCVPIAQMKSNLIDNQVMLPHAAVMQLLNMAILDPALRSHVALRITEGADTSLRRGSASDTQSLAACVAESRMLSTVAARSGMLPAERLAHDPGRSFSIDSFEPKVDVYRNKFGLTTQPADGAALKPTGGYHGGSIQGARQLSSGQSAPLSREPPASKLAMRTEPHTLNQLDPPMLSAQMPASPLHGERSKASVPSKGKRRPGKVRTEDPQPERTVAKKTGLMVRLDALLETLLDAWSAQRELKACNEEKRLLEMANRFDEDGNGALDFNEFVKLFHKVYDNASPDEILPLFESTLAASQTLRAREGTGGAPLSFMGSAGSSGPAMTFTRSDAIDPRSFAQAAQPQNSACV